MVMQITRTVRDVARVQNSTSGNPRYKLFFTDGSAYRTEPDAGFNDDIKALGDQIKGRTYKMSLTRKNRITTLDPA